MTSQSEMFTHHDFYSRGQDLDARAYQLAISLRDAGLTDDKISSRLQQQELPDIDLGQLPTGPSELELLDRYITVIESETEENRKKKTPNFLVICVTNGCCIF